MNIKKVIAKLPTGFVSEAESMDRDALRECIIQASGRVEAIESERAADEKLNGAKEIVKDLAGPYADAIKCQRAKVAYCLHLLAERGEGPDVESSE